MRVLVLGGSGFIGQFLVPELRARGHAVATFSRHEVSQPGVVSFTGERRELAGRGAELRRLEPDVVVDLILSSGAQARELVDLFRGATNRIVLASSMDVYRACAVLHRLEDGLQPVPLTEDSALRTKPPYPPSQVKMLQSIFGWLDDEYDKVPAEREILGADDVAGTVLRLPMIYGPGDRLHRIGSIVARMDAGTADYAVAESLAQWRGPRGYVGNVAHAIALAVENDCAAGRVYNVAEPENFSELEWARQVATASGWSGRIVVVPDTEAPPNPLLAANLAQHWSADSTRIRNELGYHEVIAVPDAIRQTIAWERSAGARR